MKDGRGGKTIAGIWPARLAGFCLTLAGAGAGTAQAQPFAPDTLHGLADVRLAAANGERGWLDGGFGKTSASGRASGDWKLKPGLATAALEWRPRFGFAASGYVSARYQPDAGPPLDLSEAYLKVQAPPSRLGRWSLRAGVFFPPVSMEHTGPAWTTPAMMSASAINSWIGEEVLVGGVEATVLRPVGDHELSVTAAVFDHNDTSGTLLSFRGWAMHGVTTGLRSSFRLPPLAPFMVSKQAPVTDPFAKLDRRIGYYGRLEWRPPAPFRFNLLYYDNAGNRIAVKDRQWAWETRFLNAGAEWRPDEATRVAAQWMKGETLMGYRLPGGLWVDVGFRAAYLLVRRDLGEDTVSARMDAFAVRDRSFRALDDNSEKGWALTGAWSRPLAPRLRLIVEGLHVASRRPARALARENPRQRQTTLQSALRFSF